MVPLAAGIFRLLELFGNANITSGNARYFASPVAVTLHIASSLFYCLAGACQFAPGLRHWHRTMGWLLIPCGIAAALSGLWMTLHFPFSDIDGVFVFLIRLLAGSAMALCLFIGTNAIRTRDFARHRSAMMRAYALGMGAATQVITHLPLLIFPGLHGELARGICMALGWIINLIVAEWVLLRKRRKEQAFQPTLQT